MVVHPVGGADVHLLPDLPDRGGKPALLGLPHDEVEDLALSARQLFHRALRRTLTKRVAPCLNGRAESTLFFLTETATTEIYTLSLHAHRDGIGVARIRP